MKLDITKMIGIAGTICSVASMLLNNYSQENNIKKEVAKEVAKALKEK